jgi:hypothetical protein
MLNDEGINVIHNYRFRELAVLDSIKSIFSDLKLTRGKYDSIDAGGKPYEIKTAMYKKSAKGGYAINKWEFDKQHERIRRQETLSYGGYIFSLFEGLKFYPEFSIIIDKPESLDILKDEIRRKQEEFILKIYDLDGRVPRDSIQFSVLDLIRMFKNDDVLVIDQNRNRSSLDYINNYIFKKRLIKVA